MWLQRVHRSSQSSNPVRKGVMRCIFVGLWQREQGGIDTTQGGEEDAVRPDIFTLPCRRQSYLACPSSPLSHPRASPASIGSLGTSLVDVRSHLARSNARRS